MSSVNGGESFPEKRPPNHPELPDNPERNGNVPTKRKIMTRPKSLGNMTSISEEEFCREKKNPQRGLPPRSPVKTPKEKSFKNLLENGNPLENAIPFAKERRKGFANSKGERQRTECGNTIGEEEKEQKDTQNMSEKRKLFTKKPLARPASTSKLQDQTNVVKKSLPSRRSLDRPLASPVNKENWVWPPVRRGSLVKIPLSEPKSASAIIPPRHRFPSIFEVRVKLAKMQRSLSTTTTPKFPDSIDTNISESARHLLRGICKENEELPKPQPLSRTRSCVFSRSLSRQNSMVFVYQLSPSLGGLPESAIVRICRHLNNTSDIKSLSHVCRSTREKIIRNRREFRRIHVDEIRIDYKWSFDHYPLPPYETWLDVLVDAKSLTITSLSKDNLVTFAEVNGVDDFELFLKVILPTFRPKTLTLNDLSEEFLLLLIRGIASAGWTSIGHVQVKDTWKSLTPLNRSKILAVTRSRRMSIVAADEVLNRRFDDFSSLSGLESPSYSMIGFGAFSTL